MCAGLIGLRAKSWAFEDEAQPSSVIRIRHSSLSRTCLSGMASTDRDFQVERVRCAVTKRSYMRAGVGLCQRMFVFRVPA